VARALNVPPANLRSVHQIHSTEVVVVGRDWPDPRPQADAMVTREKGIALGILTADCAPILFHDPVAGVIGAAHAGWKGALGNIAARTLQAMFDLGARPSDTSVAIGPCISKTNYETGPEFRDRFLAADVANAKFFDHRNFDLPGFILAQISGLGLKATHWTGHCTYADADRFFSFRRTTHAGASDYGRLISAIAL
jgi:polyphenol oxidase